MSQIQHNRWFERNGLGVFSDVAYGSNGDWIVRGAQFGKFDGSSYSIDATYRHLDFSQPNGDLEDLSLWGKFKQRLSPRDSIYLQPSYYKYESGDTFPHYDPAQSNPGLRIDIEQTPFVAGYQHEWTRDSRTLAIFSALGSDLKSTDTQREFLVVTDKPRVISNQLAYDSSFDIYSLEIQQMFRCRAHSIVVGGAVQDGRLDTSATAPKTFAPVKTPTALSKIPIGPLQQNVSHELRRWSLYAYDHWQVADSLSVDLGFSLDALKYPANHRNVPLVDENATTDQASPKVGILWRACEASYLRGAYTRSLTGVALEQAFRIEPTVVGGVNQTFRSVIPEAVAGPLSGASVDNITLEWDYRTRWRTYLAAGGQHLRSDVDQEFGYTRPTTSTTTHGLTTTPRAYRFRETSAWANIHQLLGDGFVLGCEYRFSRADLDERLDEFPDLSGAQRAMLHRLNLSSTYNHPSGFFGRLNAAWTFQLNDAPLPDEGFWHLNIGAGYRFWQRRGEVQVGVLNLTNQDFRLNPLNFMVFPPRERTFVAQLRLLL